MRRTLGALIGISAGLWIADSAMAVPAPLPAPDLTLVTNGEVNAIAHQTDGGIVFGGTFSSVNGIARANIARQSPNGTLDLNWNPSADGAVQALAVDTDSNAVYVGGTFRAIGGVARFYLAKLAGGGAGVVDSYWNPGANASVQSLATDPSTGAVFAGGDFSHIGNESRLFLAKLSGDGAGIVDKAWNPAPSSYVYALALDANAGVLYAGGKFTGVGGQARNYLAKIPVGGAGVVDDAWNPSANALVRALVVDSSNGAVYAGGQFTSVGGQSRTGIAKLAAGGTGAPRPEWTASANGFVYALSFDGSDSIYAGGNFTVIGGQSRKNIARLSLSTGSVDVSWNPSSDGKVTALATGAGTVYAGGGFSNVGGEMHLGFVALSAGIPRAAIDAERNASVYALAAQADGSTIVGGDFYKADQVVRNHILRLQADGTLDLGWDPSATATVRALAADAETGMIYVGGDFKSIAGQSRRHIARLSGSGTGAADSAWNPTSEGPVLALAPDATGDFMYAAGDFLDIGGQPRRMIAKLSVNGSGAADPVWNPTANQSVNSIAVDPSDGSVFVGGAFSNIGGRSRPYLAKLSGSGSGAADANWNVSMLGSPRTLVVDPLSDTLYVGGSFTVFGAPARSVLARFSASAPAVLDPLWNPMANGTVFALALEPVSRSLYVAGEFLHIGDQERYHFAKISADGSGAVASGWNPSADDNGHALAISAAGDAIVIGGVFSKVSGETRGGVAALPLDDPYGTNITVTQKMPQVSVAGETVVFSIHVTSDAGTPTGSVEIAGTTLSCSVELDANGDGNCSIAFPHPGAFTLAAKYEGDGSFAAASSAPFAHDVMHADTTLTILGSSPNPSAPPQLVTFTASLVATSPGAGTPSGRILVGDGVNACSIPQGSTSCTARLMTRGPRTITARYDGDGDFNPSIATVTHNVNRLPVTAGDIYSIYEDGLLTIDAVHGVLVNDSDPDGDAMTIANTGFAAVLGISGTALIAVDGSFTYTPPPDAHGTATFDYTSTDGYETASATATITVSPVNDPPAFLLAASPSLPAGASGPQTFPSFATVANFGPPNESSQQASEWIVRAISDSDSIASDVAVALDGTLSYMLSGRTGTATFGIALRDDGGISNGGNDTSAELTFTISVAAATDLSIDIDDGTSFVNGGLESVYSIVVRNAGPSDVVSARVVNSLPFNLVDANWTCTPDAGATCAPSGSGDIDDIVHLGSGTTLTYELVAMVLADPEQFVENTVTVTAPIGIPDTNHANDSATDVNEVGIYADGFD